jgi:hypothetical protein
MIDEPSEPPGKDSAGGPVSGTARPKRAGLDRGSLNRVRTVRVLR